MHPSETWLWRSALVDERPDSSRDEQAFFALHLNAMREKANALVARIAADMPGYTVHDASHLDALWETASLVASRDLALNPPEAFVFGGAVLLHDAGMTLAAYPGGLAELKETTAWADAAALHEAGSTDRGEHESNAPSEAEVIQITAEVLRRLHAEKAAELATRGWRVREADDDHVYLIDDPDLRKFYGPSIGIVAHSHWWPIARVERDLAKILGAMPPHTRLRVDLLKVAVLLRVSDALHLDRRRAPRFARALEQPRGVSALHWTAQERLAFPHVDGDAVVFTAGQAFESKDAEAWWLAYDAFALADQELRDADLLLRDAGRGALVARRVKGVGDPGEMARHVPVDGWRPVETRVRVSDIPKIVETLGGQKLYGDRPTVPVRELLQNALDAIQARRRLQSRASDWGSIVVELAERPDGIWLSVEDSGIGMSETVLTGPLLDFGSSLWRSPEIAEEYPGLAARGMEAIGRFGIGFFSVFMLGDEVRVTTRRYDRGEDDALALEFRTGLGSRPILSSARPGTAPLDGGTRVEVRLRHDPRSEDEIVLLAKENIENPSIALPYHERDLPPDFPSLANLVERLAPASDVSIDTIEFGRSIRAVSAGDWLMISAADLAERVLPAGRQEDRQRRISEEFMRTITTTDGQILGRAAIYPARYTFQYSGALIVGGLRITRVPHMLGVVSGEVATAARDEGRPRLPRETLSEWAKHQVELVEASDLSAEHKSLCAEVALESGVPVLGLPVAKWGDAWLDSDDLRQRFAQELLVIVVVGEIDYEDYDPVPQFVFDQHFEPSNKILFITELDFRRKSHLENLALSILDDEWGGYEEEDDFDYIVGTADGEQISRLVRIFRRPSERTRC